ncbi:TetR/AcrR family transcriptional regulator [Alicyclobacillus mali (ex Roth et al. 2021)]|uniref:TetR/AcrR family transcriptional regulator n=1 Tax=Alicyclobacillus mali (ex Roth et al. 2021) TaxID=1123961 RepID=UPI0008327927|nr:TetR/AcrR family transcriptional regulator [Alicyclobacillus mali (ex Roth et al. 2021)]MCL6489940.1 TetR/AcrR family transcriptional regulator [Alicyclobacillus mali (ex Roth et al. 2021)]
MDRRVLKSRQAIRQAFVALMKEKDFDHITVQDITDRANVSRKTFYLHFLDKYDLLDRVIEDAIREMDEFGQCVCELDWVPATEHCFQYLADRYDFFGTMLTQAGAPYFRRRYVESCMTSFREEIRKVVGRHPLPEEDAILQFVVHAYVGTVEWWLQQGMPHSPRVMADRVGRMLEAVYAQLPSLRQPVQTSEKSPTSLTKLEAGA